jgi:L-fucose isomerase
MAKATRLGTETIGAGSVPVIGVCATGDPRIDQESRDRAVNIIEMAAGILAERVKMADGAAVPVVWSDVLVDGEPQADTVARQFKDAGVNIIVCVPDTWAFPQLSLISLLQQFPEDTPLNLTCGNSGPRPGVVFVHAANGAISQYGRLVHINVGTWPDTGQNPVMTDGTADALVDWAYAAVAKQAMQGRRVVIFGHDSMGMETALAHVIPTRKILGLEIARLDMKLLSDMVNKQAWDVAELKALRAWIEGHVGDRLELRDDADSARFDQSLGMYLIVRDIMDELNAVGGGFMSQLEWGSDPRGIPLPVADAMESLFNSTFDHNGRKPPMPFATEADAQGLLTMLAFTSLTAGNPPLFMDFRKVWEPWEIERLAGEVGVGLGGLAKMIVDGIRHGAESASSIWLERGFVDGDNSGSASLDWAGLPGEDPDALMSRIAMPLADPGYFPGGGNSVFFISPGGIEGIAGRICYSALTNTFSMIWDEAMSVELPDKLANAVCKTSTDTWPHTFVTPKHATMLEYKQFAPANHFHMTWGLSPARLEYWMDLTNVLSATPWQARPEFIEGVDRPMPLLYVMNGGETATKLELAKRA